MELYTVANFSSVFEISFAMGIVFYYFEIQPITTKFFQKNQNIVDEIYNTLRNAYEKNKDIDEVRKSKSFKILRGYYYITSKFSLFVDQSLITLSFSTFSSFISMFLLLWSGVDPDLKFDQKQLIISMMLCFSWIIVIIVQALILLYFRSMHIGLMHSTKELGELLDELRSDREMRENS